MATVGEIYNFIDEFAPFSLAEKWDNSGLLIGNKNLEVSNVLLCLDITREIALEAVEKGASLIISHHPIIFDLLRSVESYSIVAILVKNDISATCAHTNLDMAVGGINDIIAEKLNLSIISEPIETVYEKPYYQLAAFVPVDNIKEVYDAMTKAGAGTLGNYSGCAFYAEGTGMFLPLEGSHAYIGEVGKQEKVREARLEMILPQNKRGKVIQAMLDAHPYEKPAYHLSENYAIIEKIGYGKIGELESELTAEAFAKLLKKTFGNSVIRYNDTGRKIKKVAICSGSGGSFIEKAISMGADAFVTGDVKHDRFIAAKNLGLAVFDAGHYHTENIVLESLKERFDKAFPTVGFSIAEQNRDILSYEK